jgi:DNA-binding transcriptional regulator WhiA
MGKVLRILKIFNQNKLKKKKLLIKNTWMIYLWNSGIVMKILLLMTVKKTIFKDKQTRVKSFQNLTTQM